MPALAVLTSVLAQNAGPVTAPASAPEAAKPNKARAAKPQARVKKKGQGIPAPQFPAPLGQRYSSTDPVLHRDFPDLCIIGSDIWTTYVEHDGKADSLQLAKRQGRSLAVVATVSRPGVVHQPAITADGAGGVWCVWGQANDQDVMTLRARRFAGGKLEDEIELAAAPDAGSSFADAGTDPSGRVWVAWQEIRPGASQIWTRHWTAEGKTWSAPVRVSNTATVEEQTGGNWEPRLAFSEAGSRSHFHMRR